MRVNLVALEALLQRVPDSLLLERRQPREVIRDGALDGLEVVELRRHFSHAGRPATDAACLYVGQAIERASGESY